MSNSDFLGGGVKNVLSLEFGNSDEKYISLDFVFCYKNHEGFLRVLDGASVENYETSLIDLKEIYDSLRLFIERLEG